MNKHQVHNRPTQNKSENSIKHKLKSYMESVAIDLFGYEKMVHRSVRNFAIKTAEELGVPPNRIFVRIQENQGSLRVFLLAGGKTVKELTVLELVQFFVGLTTRSAHLEANIVKSVLRFLKEYAQRHHIQPGLLQVLISSTDKGAVVTSFHDQQFMEYIPVKSLIQYFKS